MRFAAVTELANAHVVRVSPLLSISELKLSAATSVVVARVHVQIDSLERKSTRDGKPFWEITVADAQGKLTLRAWSDAPAFTACESLRAGEFLEIQGEFAVSGSFGVESKRWTCRELEAGERDALLAGPPALREKQQADFATITELLGSVRDPRLHHLAHIFLQDLGARFRRTAAARGNHHARRGGLVEHVAQMMRLANAVCSAYPTLNRDLLLVAVLFHDCGKLWENSLPVDGFTMPYDERGELLGHITIGIELVNTLWRKMETHAEAAEWKKLQPASEDVRLHLLHLLASHHGELQWGSPVVPKTPEAMVLHYVDNMDAKLEMMFVAYGSSKKLAPRIQERVWPLQGHLVAPLGIFQPE